MSSMTPAELNESSKSPNPGRQELEFQVECSSLSEKNGLPVKGEVTVMAAEACLDVCVNERSDLDRKRQSGNKSVSSSVPSRGMVVWQEEEESPKLGRSKVFEVPDIEDTDLRPVMLVRQRAIGKSNPELHFPDEYEWHHIDWSNFETFDGNVEKNRASVFYMDNHNSPYVRLYGWTRVGKYRYRFPVACNARTFLAFLRDLQNWDPSERRMLLLNGMVSRRLWMVHRHVFPRSMSMKGEVLGLIYSAICVFPFVVGYVFNSVVFQTERDFQVSFLGKLGATDMLYVIHSFLSRTFWSYRSERCASLSDLMLHHLAFSFFQARLVEYIELFPVSNKAVFFSHAFHILYAAFVIFDPFENAAETIFVHFCILTVSNLVVFANAVRMMPSNVWILLAFLVVAFYLNDDLLRDESAAALLLAAYVVSEIVPLKVANKISMETYTVIHVFAEELVKLYVGAWQFGLFECLINANHFVRLLRAEGHVPWKYFVGRLAVFAVHCVGWLNPIVGLLAHLAWNWYWKDRAPALMGTVDLDSLGEVAFFIDVARKLMNKDLPGLLLNAGMRASYFANLMEVTHTSSMSELVELVPLDENGDGDEIYMLAFGDNKLVDELVPAWIRKSPTIRRIAALSLLVTGASIFRDSELVQNFAHRVDWDQLASGESPFVVCVSGIKAVLGAIWRVAKSGDWKDIFDAPPDVTFLRRARSLLYSTSDVFTEEEILDRIVEARVLIDMRDFRVNTTEISKYVDALYRFVKEQVQYLEQHTKRLPPMLILEMGEPGVGKTIANDSLIETLARQEELKRFAGDVIDYNIEDKFPASSGLHRKAHFLVANDIRGDYTEFPKTDRMDLGLFLQKVLDTAPYDPRAAAVEEKGTCLNDLKFVIMTSNNLVFKCASETAKLKRRMASGVCVWIDYSLDGKKISYAQYETMSPAERNACTWYTVMEPQCRDMSISFQKTEMRMHVDQFIVFVKQRAMEHRLKVQKIFTQFQSRDAFCECGVALPFHQVMECGRAMFRPISLSCFKTIEERSIGNVARPSDNSNEMRQAYLKVSGITTTLGFDDVATHMTNSVVTFFTFLVCLTAIFWFYDLFEEKCEAFYLSLKRKFVFHPLLTQYIERKKDAVASFELRAIRAWFRIREFCRDHAKHLMLFFGLSLASLAVYFRKRNENTTLASPIFREQVDADSMRVVEFSREVNFDINTARKWNKVTSEMKRAEIVTVGVGMDDLIRRVRGAVVKALFNFGSTAKEARVAIFSPELILINKHYFLADNKFKSETFDVTIDGIVKRFRREEVIWPEGREYCWLENRFRPFATSLHKFLTKDVGKGPYNVICVNEERSFPSIAKLGYAYSVDEGGKQYNDVLWWPQTPEKGMCSSLVVTRFGEGAAIVGAVSFGCGDSTGGCVVTQADYSFALSEKAADGVEVALLEFPDCGPLAVEAEVRNVVSPYLIPLGTVKGPTRSFHTRIRKSRLYDDVSPYLTKPFSPPVKLRGLSDRGEYQSAFMHTFANINVMSRLPMCELRKAMKAHLREIVAVVENRKIKLRPIELAEAIFGCPEMDIDRIAFTTAVGKRLRELGCKNKYDLFLSNPDGTYSMLKTFRDDVATLIENLSEGIYPPVVVEFSPKDEVRALEKVEDCKIRLFSVAEFHVNAVMRMFLMPLITLLMSIPFISECFGQMNAGSKEWTQLVSYLRNDHFIDMDFKNFDSSHDSDVFTVIGEFFYELAIAVGYTLWEAKIAAAVSRMLRLQILLYLNDVIIKLKGLPSGVVLTLILNSLVNSWLMRCSFSRLTLRPIADFKKFVKPATVGDDNISGISASIVAEYNMITIAPLYLEWGYTVTSASKSSDLKPTIELSEAIFVKRRFVLNDKLGLYMAPLEKDSILKSLCFESVDMGTTAEERLVDIASGCQREAFLHGREYFQWMQEHLIQWFAKHQMEHVLTVFAFESLEQEFVEGSFRTFAL